MNNIMKKLVIKSYTKDYYIEKLDEIETIRMKTSIQNEFTSFVRFALSYMWLHFYTSIIDFFINSFIILGIVFFKISVFLLIFFIIITVNKF